MFKKIKAARLLPVILIYELIVIAMSLLISTLIPVNIILKKSFILAGIPLLIYVILFILESIFASVPLEHKVNIAVSIILAHDLIIPTLNKLGIIFKSYAQRYNHRYPDNGQGIILAIYVGFRYQDKIMKRLQKAIGPNEYYLISTINDACFKGYRLDGFLGIKNGYFRIRFKKITEAANGR